MNKRSRPPSPNWPRLARKLLGALGVVILLVSLLFLAVFVGQLFGESKTERPVLIGLVIFFAGTAVAGGLLARSGFRQPPTSPRLTDFEREHRILDRAHALGGRVTVAEIAAECDLSLEDSKRLLDRFAVTGAATVLVTDDGIMVYDFPGFISKEQKARAEEL